MKLVRRLLLGVAAIVLLLIAAFFALQHYLNTKGGAERITAKIQEAYGAPLEVGGVDVGLGGSSLTGLKLYEAPAPAPVSLEAMAAKGEPWAVVDRAAADVSLLTAAR